MLEIRKTVHIPANPATVWGYFSSQELLRKWFAADIDIALVSGGKHRHVSGEGRQLITGEVVELEPMAKLVLSWLEAGNDSDWLNPIHFRFTLDERHGSTEVDFVIDGFEAIGNADYQATYQAYVEGTNRHHVLQNLKGIIENSK